jgi:hypothetical protein
MTAVFLIGMCFVVCGGALAGRRHPYSFPSLMTGVILLVVYLFMSGLEMVFARDINGLHANSPLKPWFDKLSSGKGLCCSMADGETVADPDWDSKDGHYRVRLPTTIDYSDPEHPTQEFKWIDVPEDALVTVPNLFGRTMVWPARPGNGTVVVRCFMPGPMT